MTIAYFLTRFQERLVAEDTKREDIERQLEALEEQLRGETADDRLTAV